MKMVASIYFRLSHQSSHLILENQTKNGTTPSGIYRPPFDSFNTTKIG